MGYVKFVTTKMNIFPYFEIIIRILAILSVVALSQPFYPFVPKIIFLDVGQGDAALILPSPGFQVLIDAGPGDYVLEGLGKYLPPNDRKIEVLILSHPHMDHMEGFLDVFNRYEVGTAIYNPVCYHSKPYEIFERAVGSAGKIVRDGKTIEISEREDWLLSIVYPHLLAGSNCYTVSNVNNGSLVTYFEYKDLKILLTGDAEQEEEALLIEKGVLSDVDILKAGHHCSKTSSSEEFLEIVQPEIAICSVGENNMYGHPHEETLLKFKQRNIKYYLTSQQGDIVINL